MKKLLPWLKTTKGKITLFSVAFGIPIIGLIIWGSNVYLAQTTAEEIAKTKVSISDQTYIVSASGITPVDWEPSEVDTTVGFIPVEALSSNYLVDRINTSIDNVKTASVNPVSGTVAISVTGKTPVIYSGTLLPSQIATVTDTLVGKNVPLEVINAVSPANPVKNISVAARGTSTTSTVGTVANLPSSTTTSLPAGVGTTSPYVAAMKSKPGYSSAAANSDSGVGSFFIFLIVGVFIFFILSFFTRRAALKNGGMNTGLPNKAGGVRNRNEKKNGKDDKKEEIPVTRFSDIAGCDEAIDEMTEMVLFLKEPEQFTRVGAKPARGALLVGPPGTGKTLLARAVAGEAGVPFYAVAGSDFVEMYVGVGAKRVRELFDKARSHPEGAIIFIDEIDAIGRKRSSGDASTANTEAEGTLNALLVEMDGFSQSNIIVLGATNRDDILDTALTRPGRLDRKVQVPLPDRAGRERILQVHARNKPLDASVDLNLMARRTPGMSGAELAQLVNEACMTAAREGRDEVNALDFDHAIATVAMGKARHSAIVTPHDRAVTAWHEGGHTVAAMVIPEADEPVSVSIIPRGPAGGVTWMAQGDDLFLTRRRAFARLVVAMGGRAAEEIYLDGEFTSGPHGDLSAATQTAMAMVTKYGMTDAGLMIKSDGLLSTGSRVTDETIVAVESLLAEALETAREVLNAHRDLLQNVVDALLENDTLTQAQLIEIQQGKQYETTMPVAPKNYRKEPIKLPESSNVVPVERVRFTEAPKRRGIKLGPIDISFPPKKDKRKKAY